MHRYCDKINMLINKNRILVLLMELIIAKMLGNLDIEINIMHFFEISKR